MASVDIRNVSEKFGSHRVDVAVGDGELVVLVGPSECGSHGSRAKDVAAVLKDRPAFRPGTGRRL